MKRLPQPGDADLPPSLRDLPTRSTEEAEEVDLFEGAKDYARALTGDGDAIRNRKAQARTSSQEGLMRFTASVLGGVAVKLVTGSTGAGALLVAALATASWLERRAARNARKPKASEPSHLRVPQPPSPPSVPMLTAAMKAAL